ncbi:MAG TPA: GGDEF domain-containing protein [Woeseiaceae bacterium]|nr:GGDEF domain-containing protein [Woeseiaceae bacterium]
MNGIPSISIAVLTEQQNDVELINSTLRGAGHFAHCHWVNSQKQFAETMAAERVELIILNCDAYPQSIRQVVKEKDYYNPEVPIIALRDEVNEVAMHDAMRGGAVDLVSVGMKKRLTAVITRELRALRAERALNSTIMSASSYKQQVRNLMQASNAAIALVQEGIVVEANSSWLKLFKLAKLDEIAGMPLMDSFDAEHQAALKGALIATIQDKWQPHEKLSVKPSIGAGDAETLELQFAKIDYDGAPCVQICIVPPDKAAAEPTKLVHDALQRDPTSLFFHRAEFLERLGKRLKKKPKSGLHVLAYVRIDNFGALRDKVGHIDSEELIAQFSEIVRKRMHPRDLAGRFEGTSLLVLLERGSARDGQVWGQQLVKQVQQRTFDVDNKSTPMTCTVAVCGMSDIFNSLESFVAATIEAYRLGKEAGGNMSVLSEVADKDTKQREFDAIWVKHLRSALMDNRFRLAQLPIAGLRSDSIQMFDLLVRMVDEQGNSVLPSEFLPAAERSNMMKNIDRWMIKSAMEFCEEHEADRVFVRLSRQSVLDASTAPWMEQEFEKFGFDCSRLVAQIPEKDAAKHIKQTQALVAGLRRIGVGFALEHYGIDQKRFQILDLLKPDYIKIDGELMHSLMTDSEMQGSVARIVEAARTRNVKTIAERVENANAMAVLFQLGLDFMQGHYVHEPEVVLEDLDSGEYQSLAELQATS